MRATLFVVTSVASLLLSLQVWAADSATNVAAGSVSAQSWPQWRGPNRDGVSSATGLLAKWPEEGPPLLWQVENLGKGMASLAVSGGRIFTLGQVGNAAKLIAVSEADGKPLWQTDVGGGNPNCTPTVDGNLVFALGRDGDLICCDAATGALVWKKSLAADFGGKMMSGWGYSESPLVDGDRLICTPGAPDAQIAALDKKTGTLVWKSAAPSDWGGDKGKDGAGYSSIVISNGAGVKQYVQLTGRGLISVAADDGRVLWTYNRVANGTANIPTPIVDGDHVFCSSGYGTGAALLKLAKEGAGVKADEVYFLKASELENHHGGMIRIGKYIYCGHGHNNGFPMCIEMMTGERKWERSRGAGIGSAAALYADGHLYFRYEDGEMALIKADPEKYELVSQFKLASVKGKSWPHPVIVDGKLFIRDQETLLCYDIKMR
ncbi:MAG: PQQ-like beta-propeller repeat protein [Planctomycetia bacterium]|nr:PQQ-like beta-propeller repeat protein [Planctomycetia bacterium]